METLKQIILRRENELSGKPYLASRVTYIEEIVKMGPSAVTECLVMLESGVVTNSVVRYEILASMVEIIENNKEDSFIRGIIENIGGQGIWQAHIGSDKFDLVLNWWRGFEKSKK